MSSIRVNAEALNQMEADDRRQDRDEKLVESDWILLRALERGTALPPEWAAYRQALRDIPQQAGFPNDIDWPEEPSA
jgi:hypothetical protein